jgi:predicted ATPase/class 3 adenylate cyclase
MRCTKCGTESKTSKKFCAECGSPLSSRCPKCAADNKPTSKFCEECGAALTGNVASAAASSPQAATTAANIRVTPEQPDASTVLDGERKTVTALFADLKGSTALMEEMDPEEARAIIDPALRIMIEAVKRYDGYVVQSTGDGIFALFGAPAAYEDHPQRGLYAALQMQRELREHGERRAAGGHAALEARIGVNTGEVVVRTVETGGRAEYTPIGHTTNLASRLQTIAPAGSIAVTDRTRKLIEGYFETRALGPTAVRGISEAIDVYEVTGLGTLRTHFELSTRRGLTKFVGRESEIEQMRRALELAMSGQGQMVAVVAEAGTGKSRLYYEFKATLPAECRVLEAYSVSHGKASAWLPVLELLRKYFGVADGDDAAARREKVSAMLTALESALQDTLPYLFGLLGIVEGADPLAQMDPRIKRQRTLDAIKRIVVRESLKQPLIVIFEDLHWIDEQTQALLDLLADSIANARVLLLVNYRPEYRHEWSNKSHYVQIGLKPLGRENAEELLAALLGDAVELLPLKRLIIERTGGNPFFIEEMAQALFDEGALVRNGVVKVTRSLSQLRLPPTVQGILAARIDRLSAEQKELLQTLAVIGRESARGLIRKMTAEPEAHVERMLAELRAAEFIYEQPALGDNEYVFKHALTQEVAYNSLLIERRKLLHERAGQALESIFADQLDDHLTHLAHHYRYSDNVTKAIEYLERSGQQAIQRSAYADAISNLTAAIDLLQKLPDSPARIQRELLLQLALGSALMTIKGFAAPEAERAFTRARGLCERLGDPPELFPALFGLWAVYLIRAELGAAHELAEQLLRRAQSARDPALLLLARYALGNTSLWMGKLLAAREHLEKAISLYDRERHWPLTFRYGGFDTGVGCLTYAAWILWHLGYPDQALKRGNEAIALAEALSHPHSLTFAEQFVGLLRKYRREARAAQDAAEFVIRLSTEHGFAFWLAQATTLRGWAIAAQGRHEEGIAQMQESLAAVRATGTEIGRPLSLSMLAERCMETGRLDNGLDALTEALAAADEHEDRHYEAETHRLKGELVLKQNGSNVEEAEICFRRAIEIARRQSAKSCELRAMTSLARLLDKRGRREEARAMLADIYGWFTEGFDTADLKDAKTLLDELSR